MTTLGEIVRYSRMDGSNGYLVLEKSVGAGV